MSANQPLLTNSDRNLDPKVIQERYELLNQGLHEAIKRFEERLIFFDFWNDPAPLGRSWCVWEIYGSIRNDKPLQAVFAPGQDEAFLEVLLGDADQVTQHIADIDTRKATYFKVGDQAMITKAIESTLTQGFVTLNAVILQRLRTWLTEITHAAVEKSKRSGGRSTKHALTCVCAGYFIKAQGAYEKALQYFEEALNIYRGNLGDRHPYVASTLNNIAGVYDNQGAYEKALQYYEEALDIRREKLGEEHPHTKAVVASIEFCRSKLSVLVFPFYPSDFRSPNSIWRIHRLEFEKSNSRCWLRLAPKVQKFLGFREVFVLVSCAEGWDQWHYSGGERRGRRGWQQNEHFSASTSW